MRMVRIFFSYHIHVALEYKCFPVYKLRMGRSGNKYIPYVILFDREVILHSKINQIFLIFFSFFEMRGILHISSK